MQHDIVVQCLIDAKSILLCHENIYGYFLTTWAYQKELHEWNMIQFVWAGMIRHLSCLANNNGWRTLKGRMPWKLHCLMGKISHQEEPWCQYWRWEGIHWILALWSLFNTRFWAWFLLPALAKCLLSLSEKSCLFQMKSLPSFSIHSPKWLHHLAIMQKVFNLKMVLFVWKHPQPHTSCGKAILRSL